MKLTAILKKIGQVLGSTANELEPEIRQTFLISCGHCFTANENRNSKCKVCGYSLLNSQAFAFTPKKTELLECGQCGWVNKSTDKKCENCKKGIYESVNYRDQNSLISKFKRVIKTLSN